MGRAENDVIANYLLLTFYNLHVKNIDSLTQERLRFFWKIKERNE